MMPFQPAVFFKLSDRRLTPLAFFARAIRPHIVAIIWGEANRGPASDVPHDLVAEGVVPLPDREAPPQEKVVPFAAELVDHLDVAHVRVRRDAVLLVAEEDREALRQFLLVGPHGPSGKRRGRRRRRRRRSGKRRGSHCVETTTNSR